MRGVYTASINISSLSAAKTLMYLTAAAQKPVKILSASVTNASNETNEQCEVTWQCVNSLGTPTGTSITPAKHERGDQAAATTVVGNVTASEPTYVSDTEIGRRGFASLNGYEFLPTPEEQPVIQGAATWGLRLLNSPTAFNAVVSVTFQEIG